MKTKMKTFITTLLLSFAFAIQAFAMDESILETRCNQIIEVLESEDSDMKVLSNHIPLTAGEDYKTISKYFHTKYYYGDTNIVFGYTTCNDHENNGFCLIMQSIGSSKNAVLQHKEAIARLNEWVVSIDDNMSEKEKADAIFNLVSTHVSYAYETIEQALAATNKRRGGYRCYDNENITAYSALMRGKSVCQGFANTFNKLCELKGVDCEIATNTFHAFNIVTVNGEKFLYDTVNGFACGKNPEEMKANYPAYYTIENLV